MHHVRWLLRDDSGRTATGVGVHAHVLGVLVHLVGRKAILISTVVSNQVQVGGDDFLDIPGPVRVPCGAEVLSFVQCSYGDPSVPAEGIHFQHRTFRARLDRFRLRPATYSLRKLSAAVAAAAAVAEVGLAFAAGDCRSFAVVSHHPPDSTDYRLAHIRQDPYFADNSPSGRTAESADTAAYFPGQRDPDCGGTSAGWCRVRPRPCQDSDRACLNSCRNL